MSAHACNNSRRRHVIQDELESFFHVLLYYAIRFLPHTLNKKSVNGFLHDYFDDYSPGPSGEYLCGHVKWYAMTQGVIDLDSYNGFTEPRYSTLSFLWPTPAPAEPKGPIPAPDPQSDLCPTERTNSTFRSNAIRGRSLSFLQRRLWF